MSVIGYGTEGCYVPEACGKLVPKLNILQRQAARTLLQTPKSTANETCTLDLNWQTVQTQMDIRLIKFRARIAGAENGTLLRACIEAQKQHNLGFERKCQQIIDACGGYDTAIGGKGSP